MTYRSIAPPAVPIPGETIGFLDGTDEFTLYIPPRYKPETSQAVDLTIHFHGEPWFAIAEHRRRTLNQPLLIVNLGQGSSVYQRAFQDPDRLRRLLDDVCDRLRDRGAPSDCRIDSVSISSFSAGYGAVREIVTVPAYVRLVDRIVLADSLYASYEGDAAEPNAKRVADQHIRPWLRYVRLAVQGRKCFVLTYSQVPTTGYASSSECARALDDAVGGHVTAADPMSRSSTNDLRFPLLERCDLGKFHLWGYGGDDAQAHMTHAHHIADVWNALDAAEPRRRPSTGGTRLPGPWS